MARPVIQGTWDDDIFVDVEGSDDALSEDVNYIFIGVCTVVKLRTKGGLPLLGLQDAVRVGRAKEETFKLQLADAAEIGALFEGYVGVVALKPQAAAAAKRSRNPTSGLKFGPILRRSAKSSNQLFL